MEHDKEHFRHLLLYYFDSEKKRLPELIDSSQKLILLLQLKHMSFDDSKVVILI